MYPQAIAVILCMAYKLPKWEPPIVTDETSAEAYSLGSSHGGATPSPRPAPLGASTGMWNGENLAGGSSAYCPTHPAASEAAPPSRQSPPATSRSP